MVGSVPIHGYDLTRRMIAAKRNSALIRDNGNSVEQKSPVTDLSLRRSCDGCGC